MLAGVLRVILGIESIHVVGFMLFPFLLMIVMEGVFIGLLSTSN